MLDVRKPLGLLFMILGATLFVYGMFFSQPVDFTTPNVSFPLKINQPCGAFMFAFGLVMWQLARFVEISTLDRELSRRREELGMKPKGKGKKAKSKMAAVEAPDSKDAQGNSPHSTSTGSSINEPGDSANQNEDDDEQDDSADSSELDEDMDDDDEQDDAPESGEPEGDKDDAERQ